jgi:hypothetical protein
MVKSATYPNTSHGETDHSFLDNARYISEVRYYRIQYIYIYRYAIVHIVSQNTANANNAKS